MEVALAATVLALTLTGMITVIEAGSKMLDTSRRQTTAAQILKSEMDHMRAQSWNTVSSYSYNEYGTQMNSTTDYGSNALNLELKNDSNFNQTNSGFSTTRTVSVVQGNWYYPTLLQVTFQVTWKGITGFQYTRSSSTYVAQNGLNLSYQRS